MDLIQIGNYISNLETNNIKTIKKLTFFNVNLWKVYRNKICGDFYATYQVSKKQKVYILKNLITVIKSFRQSKNKIFLRVHSGTYSEIKDENYHSNRINNLKQSINSAKSDVFILGIVSLQKYGKLFPRIDLSDSFVDFFSSKLKYLVLFFVLLSSVKHFSFLKSFTSLSFKNILNMQATFSSKYLIWKWYYAYSKPEKVVFTFASYGCEAEISALKSLKVKVIEYQHGYIYSEHYGYNYSECLKPLKSQLMLPEELLLYGIHWKEILLKIGFFSDHELYCVGNSSFEKINLLKQQSSEKVAIIVCSQPNSAHIFINFIKNYTAYSPHKDLYHWFIKLHPRELIGEWANLVAEQSNVTVSNEDTYKLLKSIDIQLTAGSTTLYEGLYFNVSNYVLLNDLKINTSENFDPHIGQVIEKDFLDEFKVLKKSDGKKYFKEFSVAKYFKENL